jgi:hypothetical protein
MTAEESSPGNYTRKSRPATNANRSQHVSLERLTYAENYLHSLRDAGEGGAMRMHAFFEADLDRIEAEP